MSASLVTVSGSAAPIDWTLSVDDEGQRDYQLTWQVQTTTAADGPDIALTCPGLPIPGQSLYVGNTLDPWAFYQRKGTAKLHDKTKSAKLWDVTLNFSTSPLKRCSDASIENPLLEPHKVRGGFNKFTKQAVKDQAGAGIKTTAGEIIKGSAVEMDDNRPTVQLDMNVSWISLSFLAQYVDAVNSDAWWGQAVRTIKCTEFNWERVLYGTCNFYFHVSFGFELKTDTWDVVLANYGKYISDGAGGKKLNRPLKAHEEIVETWLDINGDATDTPTFFDQTSGALAKKRLYREKAFSSVGWPAVLF